MNYEINMVVQVARAHHSYLEGLLTHASSFPRNEWMDKGRHTYLSSDRYKSLTFTYSQSVPMEIREQLRAEVEFFLKRILDPKYEGDIQFEKSADGSLEESRDSDEGND